MINLDEIRQQLNLLADEELASILREHDMEQWRPEVFDIVGSILRERGVTPGEGREDEESILNAPASLNLVAVANYFTDSDAETDRLALEAKGLKAWIFSEYAPAMGHGGVQLRVCAEDLPAAMAILESERVPSSDLPAEIAEPPCPKCGSRNVAEEAAIPEPSAAATGSWPVEQWLYHCASCGHKWSE